MGSWLYFGMQITTARKAVTLLLSYLIFTKPMTEQHGTGLLLIAMGIILKMLPESKAPTKSTNSISTAKHKNSYVKEEKSLVEKNGEDEEKRPLVWVLGFWHFYFSFHFFSLFFLVPPTQGIEYIYSNLEKGKLLHTVVCRNKD